MKAHRMATLRFAVFAIFISTALDVFAEAIITDPSEKPAIQAAEHTTPMGTAITGAGNSSPIRKKTDSFMKMTCWQFGKLIFEQPIPQPKDKLENMQVFQNPETGSKMYLFDFKTSFCLIR